MFRHPLQEVLNTYHMKGEEAFLIFVFLVVVLASVKHVDAHLIYLTDSMQPKSFLFNLGASLLITNLNDVSDQCIKLHQMDLVRLCPNILLVLLPCLFISLIIYWHEWNLALSHVES